MKVIIFGATGGTGRLLVRDALAAGHEVTAFVRDRSRLAVHDPRLTVVEGDATDAAEVERAVAGHEAVLSTIGAPARDASGIRARSTGHIIAAMKRHAITRLVCITVMGTGADKRHLPFHLRYLIFPLYLRRAIADHTAQERLIEESGLDWTIVKPPSLTDAPPMGRYRHGFPPDDRSVKLRISRADVAAFMLRQLTDDTYRGRAAALSD